MYVQRLSMFAVCCACATLASGQDTLPPGQAAPPAQRLTPEQFSQMVSYALGRSIAQDCQMGGVEVNIEALQAGIGEVQAGKAPQIEEQQLSQVMQSFAMRIQQRMAADNKQRGEAFLAENAKKEGVQVTPSGLQYKVLREGNGATPNDQSVVICHYRGTFTNGQQFESSYDGGQPAQFPVGRVIPGWTEALKMMQEGAKYQLFIPSHLAYGESGRSGIGPNETLVFEIELLKVAQPQQ